MATKIPPLSLERLYPAPGKHINLNCCDDVDCGNYGVGANFSFPSFKGRNVTQKRIETAVQKPSLIRGAGKYKLTSSGGDENHRISSAFECENDPHVWKDARSISCQHDFGNRVCGILTSVLPNEHLEWHCCINSVQGFIS